VRVNPHETLDILTRWHAAGLDPDCRCAELAMSVLDRVVPAGAWAFALSLGVRVYATAEECDRVRVLVAVVVAVGEA
jgi:hypothetical protein